MTLTADIIAAIVKADDEAPVMGQVLDPGETVTFRVAGKQGDQGPQGKVGPEGPQGKRGFDGEIGVMGPLGNTGPEGPQGVPGVPGKDGAKGPKGDMGATGSTGPKGDTGDRGPQGPAGAVVMTRMAAGGGGGGGGGGAALSDAVPLVESGAGGPGVGLLSSRDDHFHPEDGGGAVITAREWVNGTTSIPPGGQSSLAWGHQTGPTLLDLTNPLIPKVVTAGIYCVMVTVSTPQADDITKVMFVGLDVVGGDVVQDGTESLAPLVGMGAAYAARSATVYFAVNDTIELIANHNLDANADFTIFGSVQRIT